MHAFVSQFKENEIKTAEDKKLEDEIKKVKVQLANLSVKKK